MRTQRRIEFGALSLFALVVGFALITHEPWRDELQAWMIARASRRPGNLIANTAHEGHPALWYLLLWPIAKLWSSIAALQILQWCIAVSTAAIVLRKAPFE